MILNKVRVLFCFVLFCFQGEPGGIRERRQRGRRRELLWCPLCLCILTHVPVLEGLMHWLRVFHWCLMGLEREGGVRGSRGSGPTALDAAVFQLTLEVKRSASRIVVQRCVSDHGY